MPAAPPQGHIFKSVQDLQVSAAECNITVQHRGSRGQLCAAVSVMSTRSALWPGVLGVRDGTLSVSKETRPWHISTAPPSSAQSNAQSASGIALTVTDGWGWRFCGYHARRRCSTLVRTSHVLREPHNKASRRPREPLPAPWPCHAVLSPCPPARALAAALAPPAPRTHDVISGVSSTSSSVQAHAESGSCRRHSALASVWIASGQTGRWGGGGGGGGPHTVSQRRAQGAGRRAQGAGRRAQRLEASAKDAATQPNER